MKKDDAIFNVLRETISSIKPELSIKNNTTKDSEQVSTPKELSSYVASKAIALFDTLEIFSERELTARYQVDHGRNLQC